MTDRNSVPPPCPPNNCPRCGQNHYDMSRPRVPSCPFTPQRAGPGGMTDPDIVAMARMAQHDDRLATGALYGALADEIIRLRALKQEGVDAGAEQDKPSSVCAPSNSLSREQAGMREALEEVLDAFKHAYSEAGNDDEFIYTFRRGPDLLDALERLRTFTEGK